MCSAIGDETLAGVFNGDDESETIGDGDGKKDTASADVPLFNINTVFDSDNDPAYIEWLTATNNSKSDENYGIYIQAAQDELDSQEQAGQGNSSATEIDLSESPVQVQAQDSQEQAEARGRRMERAAQRGTKKKLAVVKTERVESPQKKAKLFNGTGGGPHQTSGQIRRKKKPAAKPAAKPKEYQETRASLLRRGMPAGDHEGPPSQKPVRAKATHTHAHTQTHTHKHTHTHAHTISPRFCKSTWVRNRAELGECLVRASVRV